MTTSRSLPLILTAALLIGACKGPEEDETPEWVLGEVVDTEGPATLAKLPGPWGGPLWLLRVEGDHYEMGYQYGRLVGPEMYELWMMYMGVIGEDMGVDDADAVDVLLGNLLDRAWVHYEPNVPADFMDELEGVGDGMVAAGVEYGDGPSDTILLPIRLITLIDLAMSSQLDFDDLGGVVTLLDTGFTEAVLDWYDEQPPQRPHPDAAAAVEPFEALHGDRLLGPRPGCSYFAAWGARTVDGGLYATRNMDFTTDSGLFEFAMVTAFVPDDGVPYASISWLGASLGVLAGISEEGLAVSAVGASSPYERIATEPALFRAREALEHATDLSTGMPYLRNSVDDGLNRAPTIGYNALLAWGDPRGGGAEAQAVILESNGLEVGVFHHHPDCSVDAALLRYDRDGEVTEWTPADHPEWVNAEADAQEIDGDGQVRLFAHDDGTLLTDEHGRYIEDPTGIPIQTGYPEPCALYRGDEAMAYGVRVHQSAANGPMRGDGVMVQSGSWQGRYWPMREMTRAYAAGTEFSWKDEVIIEDNGGTPVPIGLDEAEAISRVAAMDSNVWDVVYDTTNLAIRVSYESGTGESWVPADDQPPFLEIDLAELFLTE